MTVTSGTCCRITTGAPLPRGADAVIQVEDTKVVKSSEDVCIYNHAVMCASQAYFLTLGNDRTHRKDAVWCQCWDRCEASRL